MNILEISSLSISFNMVKNIFKETKNYVIKDISLSLKKGEILTIVGSSGSGKSVFSSALFGLLPKNANVNGEIYYKGEKVSNIINKAIYIPQSSSYLDPLIKVSKQISLSDNELSQKANGLYPFQCSGGMIRNAFFDLVYENEDADIIIADEPTPGMDLATALKVLKNLRDIADSGKSVILITHDIDLAIEISDRVAVFYDGSIVEIANATDFSQGKLRHQYTRALYDALPQNSFYAENLPKKSDENGCFYSKKCEDFTEKCKGNIGLKEISNGFVRCANASMW